MSDLSNYTDDELFDLYDSNIGDEIRSRGYEYGWYKKVVYVGEIYVLVNRAFPNLVKIGYSKDANQRAKQLSSGSGVPAPYHVYATYKVKKALVDKRLHELIDTLNSGLHYSSNREFFEMSPEDAYGILKAIAEITGDEEQLSLNPYCDEYVSNLLESSVVDSGYSDNSDSESESDNKGKGVKRKSRPPFNFHEFGIPDGSELVFFDAKSHEVRNDITAVVSGGRNIIYGGKVTSLSRVAKEFAVLKHSPRGTEWWMYNGRLLVDIYTDKYPKLKTKKKD